MEEEINHKRIVGQPVKYIARATSTNKTLYIKIPYRQVKANGWKEGDFFEVWVKKMVWEDNN